MNRFHNIGNIKKPKSQENFLEGRLCMTHGEPLNLRQDEISRLLTEKAYKTSRENTANSINTKEFKTNTLRLPGLTRKLTKLTFSRDVTFCHCVRPIYPSRTSSFTESELTRCTRCSGIIRKTNLKTTILSEPIVNDYLFDMNENEERLFQKKIKLPPIVDPNRYQKAYLKALRVAKFGTQDSPETMYEFFNHQITPAFIFSYVKHTPRCLNTPKNCPMDHKLPSERKIHTSNEIHRSIFKNVNVDDYLEN
jgi:hypothetical protein